MNGATPFAFITGLHLAQLQFCYFFLLLINVTSTYVTYASIVISWMMGTVLGLVLRRLDPVTTVVVGVASYYLVRLIVLNDPLAPYVLPVACAGVLLTGLWAGHFFIALLSAFRGADRLFLHENNGFLLGVITTFAGFTLGGRTFLFWAPLVSGLATLAFFGWRRWRSPALLDAAAPPVPGTAAAGLAGGELRLIVRVVGVTIVVVPLLLAMDAGLREVSYWKVFEGERNILTFISSLLLVLIGIVAFLNYHLGTAVSGGWREARGLFIWIVFALGFVFLAIDERFEVHEFVRDEMLRPGGIGTGMSWVRPGDIVLFVYFAVGAALTLFLWRELRRARRAPWLFGAALALAGFIVVVDALPDAYTESWPLGRFWTSAFEEVGELWAQFLFLLAFVDTLTARLKQVAGGDPAGGPVPGKGAGPVLADAGTGALRALAVVLVVVNIVLPVCLYVYAVVDDQPYWRPFRADGTAVSWLSSLQLLLIAVMARLIYVSNARIPPQDAFSRRHNWLWLAAAWAFVVFAFDERLDLHEGIRDNFLRPSGLFTDVSWLVSGDVVLYFFWALAVAVSPWLLRDMTRRRGTTALFTSAILLAFVVIVIDSLKGQVMRNLPYWRFWDYVFEELGELWVQLLLLFLFLRELTARLAAPVVPGLAQPGVESPASAGNESSGHGTPRSGDGADD